MNSKECLQGFVSASPIAAAIVFSIAIISMAAVLIAYFYFDHKSDRDFWK